VPLNQDVVPEADRYGSNSEDVGASFDLRERAASAQSRLAVETRPDDRNGVLNIEDGGSVRGRHTGPIPK
jgi:hypothetical protein